MHCFFRISRHAIFFFFIIMFLALGILAHISHAQSSDQDFLDLQQRSLDENWTFSISRTNAFLNPPNLPEIDLPTEIVENIGKEKTKITVSPLAAPSVLPDSWNWCDWGICSPVKDQAGCGGCFAFAAMGIFESNILLNDATVIDLSEQWAISCTGAGNCGGGGFPGTVLNYTLCNASDFDACGDSGVVLESDFPFAASDVACDGCPYNHPYCASSWSYVDLYTEIPSVENIKRAIIEHGPVSVYVAADTPFLAYSGGIFNACDPAATVNHYVIIVGWDDNQGSNGVWFLRNSHGTRWGEDANGNPWDFDGDGFQDNDGGYMRIEYECNSVGGVALYMQYQDSNEAVWADFSYSGTEDGSFWQPFSSRSQDIPV
jgi:C1A family cysteine protease